MKLELKHVAGYLPYSIIVVENDTKDKKTVYGADISVIYFEQDMGNFYNEIKPILRPLSDLTKEIEVNREKFVPIIELCKIAYDYLEIDKLTIQLDSANGAHTVMLNSILSLSFDSNDNSFIAINKCRTVSVPNQLKLFDKFHEWHFDIHDLIKNNLAIDINTLK